MTVKSLHLSKAGLDYLTQLERLTGQSESLVVRAMFSVATRHRPEVLRKLAQLAAREQPLDLEPTS